MNEISILVENCGGQNKNNVMIRFLNMIKEGEFIGANTLRLYIKGHTKNDCTHAFNILEEIYRKQMPLLLRSAVKILIPEIILKLFKCFTKNFFDLESFLNDVYDRPDSKTVNINHVFQMKKSQHKLVIVKSFMARQSLNRMIRGTIPTSVHIGRE